MALVTPMILELREGKRCPKCDGLIWLLVRVDREPQRFFIRCTAKQESSTSCAVVSTCGKNWSREYQKWQRLYRTCF